MVPRGVREEGRKNIGKSHHSLKQKPKGDIKGEGKNQVAGGKRSTKGMPST